ncbi:unnamed protein product [Diatraea saccharalis]|uniref:Collagenase NC10/endostatin domain-containing protein n=1 Tax=Diatraea saccharalis TaxID=40085 RepID=A0A9N9RAL5_9NEOP|nr:unnamed protein product [Diatraea saccharalis]
MDSIVNWKNRDTPVVNTRGDVLFNSWAEMFDGSGALFAHAPRIFSFSGQNVLMDPAWPTKAVWHGANPNGESAMDAYSCSSRLIVLCVETAPVNTVRRKKRSKYRTDLLKPINKEEQLNETSKQL